MGYRVILRRDTLGITQLALKSLRNELAARISHEICVIEVPGDFGTSGCYGFFIVDKDSQEVIVIGDGFRADGGGEGGAGHRAAQALLSIYGIHAEQALDEESIDFVDDQRYYNAHIGNITKIAEEMGFKILAGLRPRYPDWIFKQG